MPYSSNDTIKKKSIIALRNNISLSIIINSGVNKRTIDCKVHKNPQVTIGCNYRVALNKGQNKNKHQEII